MKLCLTADTFQSQDDLLGGLGFLVENWLGLTTVTGLLPVISSLTLGVQRSLTSLVLGNSVLSVLSALLTLTVGLSGLWNVNCIEKINRTGKGCVSKLLQWLFLLVHGRRIMHELWQLQNSPVHRAKA